MKFSLSLINPQAMKMHGGAAVSFHAFLISAPDAGVCWASQSGTQPGPRTHVTLCRKELILVPPHDRTQTASPQPVAQSLRRHRTLVALTNSANHEALPPSCHSLPPSVSVLSRTLRRINSAISNWLSVTVCCSVWPLVPARYRRRGLLLHLSTLSMMHTPGRTTLHERSARYRDLYLTKHNTHNRQTSMPPAGSEPTISAGERSQTYALDRAATGFDISTINHFNNISCESKLVPRSVDWKMFVESTARKLERRFSRGILNKIKFY